MAESATLSTYAATRRSLPEMMEAASRAGRDEDMNILGSLSSPADLFRSKTWDDIGSSLKQGGSVGALLKKIF